MDIRSTLDSEETPVKLTKIAAILTIIISVMNLPAGFAVDDVATAVAWAFSLFGLIGLVAGTGALRGVEWGPFAVLTVGSVNLVASVVALIADVQGAVIGIVISAAIVAAIVPSVAAHRRTSSAIATSR